MGDLTGTKVYTFSGDCPPEGYEKAPVVAIIIQGVITMVDGGAVTITWDDDELGVTTYPSGYDFYNIYITGDSKLETINRIIELQTKIYNLEFEISKLEDTLPKLEVRN